MSGRSTMVQRKLLSYKVAAEGAEPTLEPNSTHTDWKWILVRNVGGKWEHKGHGY